MTQVRTSNVIRVSGLDEKCPPKCRVGPFVQRSHRWLHKKYRQFVSVFMEDDKKVAKYHSSA